MTTVDLLKQERASIVALLESLDESEWHAATLCAGWDVTDLVAHMVVRENKPLTFIVSEASKGKLGPTPDELVAQTRQQGHQQLLAKLRQGPPLLYRLPGPSAWGNLVENWVHNEDLRRGELQRPRTTPPQTQRALWRTLQVVGRLMLQALRVPGVVALQQPDGTALAFTVGDGFPRKANPAAAAARIVGEPAEILLFMLGRKATANVQIEGDGPLVEALQRAKMSI